jgi:hypothetical protein
MRGLMAVGFALLLVIFIRNPASAQGTARAGQNK